MSSPEKHEPFEGKSFVDDVPPNRFIKFLSRFLQIETDGGEAPEGYAAFKSAQKGRTDYDID